MLTFSLFAKLYSMTNIELQDLKIALASHIREDVQNIIKRKGYNATYQGGAVGTSLHGNDSVFIDLLVDKPNSKKIVAITIHFFNNLNELFDLDSFIFIDMPAGMDASKLPQRKRLPPVDLARLRIMWTVITAIRWLIEGQLDYILEHTNKITVNYTGTKGAYKVEKTLP